MKIIFFGSSDYCLPILESLNRNFQLTAVVTKKGQAAEKFAQSHNVNKVFTPSSKQELLSLEKDLKLLSPGLALVADYGLIIPAKIFSIPRYRTLNIHFSRLPLLRGPSPVQYTILTGQESAWISIIIMDAQMDTGDIIWQKEIKLLGNETTGVLYQNLFNTISVDLPDIINKFVKNEINPQKQDHSLATYTRHFTRDDGFIPSQLLSVVIKGIQPTKEQLLHWKLYSEVLSKLPTTNYQLPTLIDCSLRALTPWPGMWTETSIINQSTNKPINTNNPIKKRLKILRVHPEPPTTNLPRRQAGHQLPTKLILDSVQLEGKKPVSWKQFLEGHKNFSLA